MEESSRRNSLIALTLVGIAPSISIFASFGSGSGLFGQLAWLTSKVWMLGLPLLWLLYVEKKPLSWSPPRQGGLGVGFAVGMAFSLIMILAWLLVGESRVDRDTFRSTLEPFGLTVQSTYIAAAIFWTVGNSVLEEYVFRWFIVERAEDIFGEGWATISLSAGIFVLHHFFALWFLGFALEANLLACFGLFVGGAAFSWLYMKYRSIWVPYITHALCDVVVFGVGYLLLFG
ncbi:MAG: type II CAAX endopeptidase family protein [Candidatus Poseidonia sp.]|uniref:CPBP family intramembrane glutamic endopeptidase n=1 Tax=Poseidonia sp. TaxID=2666344 RepID=UPI0030BD3919|nr:type II CAAX endopeptidase family protein [Poseidonia sp.]MDG1552930.1 type II CAAX endopeptidase family protein [Poseidonia sp.]